jgi:transcriptional regulator with XRE-family HTH domain
MRSKVLQNILDETPKDVAIFVDKYADLVLRINQILSEKGYTQKSLAEKMEKRPSEIHKWLSGDHNFTLRSIAKLEAELGETLLEVPVRKPITAFHSNYEKTTYTFMQESIAREPARIKFALISAEPVKKKPAESK